MVSCFLQGEGLSSQSCACLKQSDDCAGGGEEREQRAGADSAAPPSHGRAALSLLPTAAPAAWGGPCPFHSRPPLAPAPVPSAAVRPRRPDRQGQGYTERGAPALTRRSSLVAAAGLPFPRGSAERSPGSRPAWAVPAARTEPPQPAGGRAGPRLARPGPAQPGTARPGPARPAAELPGRGKAFVFPSPAAGAAAERGLRAPGERRFPTRERGCGCCSAPSAAALGCDGRFYYYY